MTEIAPPDVILLRTADDPDPYVHAFSTAGLRAVCRPVLDFAFPNDATLRARLQERDRYGGLVATSPRAGRAVRRVFDADGTAHAAWEGAPAYVVGPKTAERFRALGFDVRGQESGNADVLASWIAEAGVEQPLLFLSGNRRRDILPEGLRNAGIAFEEQVVYETLTRNELSLPPPSDGTWLVFFSPSGLEAARTADAALDEYRCAAIGPTTAAALEEQGRSVQAVAESPSPEGLLTAIQDAEA
jgi:uroporphyrinogen-III synthase